jgi:hypothetical protein
MDTLFKDTNKKNFSYISNTYKIGGQSA